MTMGMSVRHKHSAVLLSFFMTYHMIFNQSSTAGGTSGPGAAYPSVGHGFSNL